MAAVARRRNCGFYRGTAIQRTCREVEGGHRVHLVYYRDCHATILSADHWVGSCGDSLYHARIGATTAAVVLGSESNHGRGSLPADKRGNLPAMAEAWLDWAANMALSDR